MSNTLLACCLSHFTVIGYASYLYVMIDETSLNQLYWKAERDNRKM